MTEESELLIKAIRESRFDWLADELTETLAAGKGQSKLYQDEEGGKKIKGTTSEPFNESEEMELICRSFLQVFFVLPSAWEKACELVEDPKIFGAVDSDRIYSGSPKKVREKLRGVPRKLGLRLDSREIFSAFSEEFYVQRKEILSLLEKLWPGSDLDFKRVAMEYGVGT